MYVDTGAKPEHAMLPDMGFYHSTHQLYVSYDLLSLMHPAPTTDAFRYKYLEQSTYSVLEYFTVLYISQNVLKFFCAVPALNRAPAKALP